MSKLGRGIMTIALSLIAIAPICCNARQLSATQMTWFQATIQKLHDAVATGDKSVWERVLAPDFIMTDEDGKVLDRRQFLSDLMPLPQAFSGTQKVRGLTVRQWRDTAVVHFWISEREEVYGQVLKTTYVETDTFQQKVGIWKMVAAQVAVVPRNFNPVRVDTRSWSALEGEYGLSGKASWPYYVFSHNGVLYGGRNRKSATRLIPLSPLVYYQKGTIHIMVFVKNLENNVNKVLELHKYNEVVLRRIPQKHSK